MCWLCLLITAQCRNNPDICIDYFYISALSKHCMDNDGGEEVDDVDWSDWSIDS